MKLELVDRHPAAMEALLRVMLRSVAASGEDLAEISPANIPQSPAQGGQPFERAPMANAELSPGRPGLGSSAFRRAARRGRRRRIFRGPRQRSH
jgi:hypothetical protein